MIALSILCARCGEPLQTSNARSGDLYTDPPCGTLRLRVAPCGCREREEVAPSAMSYHVPVCYLGGDYDGERVLANCRDANGAVEVAAITSEAGESLPINRATHDAVAEAVAEARKLHDESKTPNP